MGGGALAARPRAGAAMAAALGVRSRCVARLSGRVWWLHAPHVRPQQTKNQMVFLSENSLTDHDHRKQRGDTHGNAHPHSPPSRILTDLKTC